MIPFLLVVSVFTKSSRLTRPELAPRNSCGVFLCFCLSEGNEDPISSRFQGSVFGGSEVSKSALLDEQIII